jgi:hypothetical protein
MKKDAYYFPHFSNARNDSKIIKVRRVLGIEGYGIYMMLLEVLREQTDFKYPINGIEDLAYEWHTSKEKIMSVINDFDLFTIEKDNFFSSKLMYYLQPYLEKSERARQAAIRRWEHAKAYANADTNALPVHSDSNASKVKESKVKESKENENKQFSNEVNELYNELINDFPDETKPNTDNQVENWKDTIEKLIRIDKYTPETIKKVVKWARKDDFWKANFMSLTKLRKKNKDDIKYMVMLKAKMEANKQNSTEKLTGYSNDQWKPGGAFNPIYGKD